MKRIIRDHNGARWSVVGGVATALDSYAPASGLGRRRLVQPRCTESQPMRDSGGQEYQRDDGRGNTRSAGSAPPPRPRTGGIYTPAPQVPRRRKTTAARGEKEHGDE